MTRIICIFTGTMIAGVACVQISSEAEYSGPLWQLGIALLTIISIGMWAHIIVGVGRFFVPRPRESLSQ